MSSSLLRFAQRFAGLGAVGAASYLATGATLAADDDALHPPHHGWSHHGMLKSFDAGSIRRGFYVYKNVCSACHSLSLIHYRNLVDVCFTEDEVKEIAFEAEIQDGPNDEGEMFTRPGKLVDALPDPYPNEEAARYANNGAYPPDLSLIVKASEAKEDYVFSVLTGFQEPPEGIHVREGLHFNPYFTGGQISMAQPLYDESIEYDDGTPATLSQLAKDVTTFLAWTAEPEHDVRKKLGFNVLCTFSLLWISLFYLKRFKWSLLKNRRIEFRDTQGIVRSSGPSP